MDAGTARTPGGWVEFAHQLRQWRRNAGLTQAQVARRLGYHNSVISKLESGGREPPPGLVRRLDEMLQTGGRLARAMTASASDVVRPDGHVHSDWLPMPGGGEPGHQSADADAFVWSPRLPRPGLPCPIHGTDGCALPGPADAHAAYQSILAAAPPHRADGETVHALVALLAAHFSASIEQMSVDVVEQVERVLHAIVRWIELGSGPPYRPLLRLAASYAQLAGELRMQRGQDGVAMAWFGKGLRWAVMGDDVWTHVTTLCDMSSLARMEHDATTADTYARAVAAVDPSRPWVALLAELHHARADGIAGKAQECSRHVANARFHLDHIDERDHAEASWLASLASHIDVEAGVAGALRDVASRTGDRRAARLAIESVERSLVHLPPQLRPAHVLYTLRLADSHACAGDPEAALAIAEPVLAEAHGTARTMIRRELLGLRARLVARWGDLAEVRDLDQRIRASAS